jgi:hypothetical protein
MKHKNKLDRESKNIYNAICHFTLFNVKEIEDSFFEKLINFIDLSNISDREFFSNDRVKKFVNYDKLNKKQLIRLATRDPEILNKVNINKFKFKIKELDYFLKSWPEYIELFSFDLRKISGDELLILLSINIKYANEVDFLNINFSKYHLTQLIKNYYHRDFIISKVLEIDDVLDNFQIRHLILQTGAKHFSKLNFDKLNELDWFTILTNRPELFNYCDISIFEKNEEIIEDPIKLLQQISRSKLDTSKLKENDHRILGQKLDLFSFNEVAPGMVFWHSRGLIIYNELLNYWREEHKKEGYEEIKTPQIMDSKLWKISGHWDKYKENNFTTDYEGRPFLVKPMNCPGGMLVYKTKTRSYKDLPLRVGEVGVVHRTELSGVLNGLFRVIQFTQDDAHIFCANEKQVEQEIMNVTELIKKFY